MSWAFVFVLAATAYGFKVLGLVLVGDRKLAGLLIDQFQPGLAVVGIGINVQNHPQSRDASLKGRVTRLADLVSRLR